jgi:MFS family permease
MANDSMAAGGVPAHSVPPYAVGTDLMRPDPTRWWALAVLLTGAFLAPLDFFIVNLALPSIAGGLHARPDEVQLVISAYAAVYAVFLITGGRLGDLFGRKVVFLGGLAGFAAASALCGLAWSPLALIAGRILQALAAAAMAPQAVASIHALFPPRERPRALSIFGMVLGLAAVAGQLLGGALVSADLGGFGWRLIFLVNLPVAIVAFAAGLRLLPRAVSGARPLLDLGGVALSAAALAALVVPLIEGRERGWPAWTLISLAMSPLLAAWFWRHEQRVAKAGGEPLVPPAALLAPGLRRSLAAAGTLYALAAFFLTVSIYLQTALDRTPWQAGLVLVPFSLAFVLGSVASPGIARLVGGIAPSLGFVASATGLLGVAELVTRTGGAEPNAALLTAALVVVGLGMGFSVPTMVRAVVERAPNGRSGLVGGVVNSMLQVSAAIAVALLGGLYFTVLGGRTSPAAIADAFATTLVAIAACHLVGAVLAAGLGAKRTAAASCTVTVVE